MKNKYEHRLHISKRKFVDKIHPIISVPADQYPESDRIADTKSETFLETTLPAKGNYQKKRRLS